MLVWVPAGGIDGMVETDLPEREWQALLALAAAARKAACAASAGTGAAFRSHLDEVAGTLRHPLARAVFAPMIARIARDPFVIAQIGQSLDCRIATAGGHSHYINGDGALLHLHRLRALADAVIVGASTVVLDDPQLTTRRVPGPSPVRVVLDPHCRVPRDARMFDTAAPGAALRVTAAAGDAAPRGNDDTVLVLPAPDGLFVPQQVLAALARRGLRTVLVEGGGETISAFLRAGRLHRLHVLLAPLLIGPGREAFHLPAIERLHAARRFVMSAHALDSDVLLDCDLEVAG